MPIKSTGCGKCRQRKIRCDETRPGCQRCKTHGVPCPGYRLPAPGQVQFQDQTEWIVLGSGREGNGEGATRAKGSTKNVFKNSVAVIGAAPTRRSESSPTDSAYSSSSSSSSDTSASSRIGSLEPDEYGLVRHETNLDFATAMELYASPTLLPSPAIEKQLIYNTFLDAYLPKSLPFRPRERDPHFSIFQHLISTPGLRREVSDSLDALSLVQVGSLFKDQNLLKQATAAYSRALRGLVRTLSAEGFVQDDYVLATCTVLSTCEFFDEIAQVGDGWSKHIDGSAQLLAARGPESLRSDLALMLFSNMKHSALSHALIARKACFMGMPEWRAVSWRTPYQDASTPFYAIALRVPAVLELHDKIDIEDANALENVEAVLQAATKLETELRNWLNELQTTTKFRGGGGDLFWLTSVSNFPVFASLCTNRAVEEAFMFSGFMPAYLMSVYWAVLFFLRSTVQSLHTMRNKADRHWFPQPDDVVSEDEIMTYVMNMCRCFPFFCEPSSSSTGQIGMFVPMFCAATYFPKHGHWKMLMWLGNVRDNVFTKGMRPPNMTTAPPGTVKWVRS